MFGVKKIYQTTAPDNPALSPLSWTQGQWACRGLSRLSHKHSSVLLDTLGHFFVTELEFQAEFVIARFGVLWRVLKHEKAFVQFVLVAALCVSR